MTVELWVDLGMEKADEGAGGGVVVGWDVVAGGGRAGGGWLWSSRCLEKCTGDVGSPCWSEKGKGAGGEGGGDEVARFIGLVLGLFPRKFQRIYKHKFFEN